MESQHTTTITAFNRNRKLTRKGKVLTLKDAESLYEDTLEAMGLDESETELDIYEQIKDRLDSRLF